MALCATSLASITATSSASTLAGAIVTDPGTLSSASFIDLPPNGSPTATATTFGTKITPAYGPVMAVFSTGDATVADTVTTSPDQGGTAPSTNDGGANQPQRGSNVFDVTDLQLGVVAPSYANCVGVNLDYLTNDIVNTTENPSQTSAWETQYEDGTIAELDPSSAWTVSSTWPGSDAPPPSDFAVDAQRTMLDSDELAGSAGYPDPNDASFATGTPFNVASGWWFVETPVTPGSHTIDLSLFDRGDANNDSVVLINGLSFFHDPTCPRGFAGRPSGPRSLDVTLAAPAAHSSTSSATPTISGSFETKREDLPQVTVRIYKGASASGTPWQTLRARDMGSSWSAVPHQPLVLGTYTVQAEQRDLAGNTGLSPSHTFTVAGKPTVSDESLSGVGKRQVRLSFAVSAGRQAPPLKKLMVSLPGGFSFQKDMLSHGLTVAGPGGGRLKDTTTSSAQTLTITLGSPATEVSVTLEHSAIDVTASEARRVTQHEVKKVTIPITATDSTGMASRLVTNVKPR